MTAQTSVDVDAQRAIQPYLQPGETLLWAEKPPGWRVAWRELFRLIFIMVWNAGVWAFALNSIPWKVVIPMILRGEIHFEPNGAFGLAIIAVPILFIVFGFVGLVLSSHIFLNGWFTYYGLTGERVIILRSLPPARIMSLGPQTLVMMSRIGESGWGTISFGDAETEGCRNWVSAPKKLIGIRNPALVDELIVSTLIPKKAEGRHTNEQAYA